VITPEQVIPHYRAQRRGGKRGQALSPPSEKMTNINELVVLSQDPIPSNTRSIE